MSGEYNHTQQPIERLYERLGELAQLSTFAHGEERTRELGREALCLQFEISERTGAVMLDPAKDL